MARSFLWMIRRGLRRMSLDVSIFDKQSPDFQLAGVIRRRKIECILDVGANRGQFARYMRLQGFKGTIHSFEPLPTAFAELAEAAQLEPLADAFVQLEAAARRDANWHVHNIALSDRSGTVELNIGANDQTSSILGVSSDHGSRLVSYTGTQTVECRRLDELLESGFFGSLTPERAILKIDVQGHELEVLKGSGGKLGLFAALFIEASLVGIYDSEPGFGEMSAFLGKFGFSPIAFKGGLHHPDHGYLMQIDVLFEHLPANATAAGTTMKSLGDARNMQQ